MGIELISAPSGAINDQPGPLDLPAQFDRKKHAAKWVKEGPAVAAAGEREWLVGTKATADGWEVWKDKEGKPQIRHLQSGKYILLCRDLATQKAVNAIYGNVGKERLLQEKRGETTGGIPVASLDPGVLGEERVTKIFGKEKDDEEGAVIMNPVDIGEKRVAAPAATASGRRRVTVKRA